MIEPTEDRGALLSDHPHPRPVLRRITAALVALGLAGIAVSVIGLLALTAIYGLPLLPLAALTLLALAPALLRLAVLHPHIWVYEHGLWIKPLLGRACRVPWESIARVEDHTLIRRGTTKAGQREHLGQLIVVLQGLTWPFLVVGLMAGLGRVRAFGISNQNHVDYPALRDAIVQRRPVRSGK